MTPTSGEAASPRALAEVKANLVLETVGEEAAKFSGEFAARRLTDNELLERTPSLPRAIEVADEFDGDAYVVPCRVKPGDPLALGLDPAAAHELLVGARLFADRTLLEQLREAPTDNQAECDRMIYELGVEKTGLPLVVVQESIYREACRLGRES